ncbi:MAG: NYN domain-containing protein [Candidatus Omnitrophota bacterium]
MPLQYIIDAYNIINHITFAPARKKITDPRRALLEFIKKRMREKKSRNKIILVFDGYSGMSGKPPEEYGIEAIFSGDETADLIIRRMVESSKRPGDIAVVSDDREIQFFIKSAGASPVGVEEFINPEAKTQRKKEELIKTELNYSQISRINQELKTLWLK